MEGALGLTVFGVRRIWPGGRTGAWPCCGTLRRSAGMWRLLVAITASAATSSTGGNAATKTTASKASRTGGPPHHDAVAGRRAVSGAPGFHELGDAEKVK